MKTAIDDRYVADNYYQSANMDELLFEKDGTISKMKQFDYKVHKFLRKKKWLINLIHNLIKRKFLP